MPSTTGWPEPVRDHVHSVYNAYMDEHPGASKGKAARIAWASAKRQYPEYWPKSHKKGAGASPRAERMHPGRSHRHASGHRPTGTAFRHRPTHRPSGGHSAMTPHFTGSPSAHHRYVSGPSPSQKKYFNEGGQPKAPGFLQGIINRRKEKEKEKQNIQNLRHEVNQKWKEERHDEFRAMRDQARHDREEKQRIAAQEKLRQVQIQYATNE